MNGGNIALVELVDVVERLFGIGIDRNGVGNAREGDRTGGTDVPLVKHPKEGRKIGLVENTLGCLDRVAELRLGRTLDPPDIECL